MPDAQANARVRQTLQKCVAKIEKSQLKDGSWNIAGGWAPILGTSMASQSLYIAQQKGAARPQLALASVDEYTKRTYATPAPPAPAAEVRSGGVAGGTPGGVAGGVIGGVPGGVDRATLIARVPSAMATEVSAASAGVPLYKRAQELEQLSRTEKDRKDNASEIKAIKDQLSDARFVTGFGSIGGEEFFSYLNIGESLHRTGGPEWEKWNAAMKEKIVKMQNEDGTWAGHHCITGRVAVTSAAILMLLADREPVLQTTSLRKN